MKSTYKLKKYVKKQYDALQEYYEKDFSDSESSRWLVDNKNRILNVCANLAKSVPETELPKGYREIRVLELARELCVQTLANVNEETVALVKNFQLTLKEYEFLPVALKISLIDMIIGMLEKDEFIENAPSAVRSLILFNDLDFDELRTVCLEQERMLYNDEVYRRSDDDTRNRYRREISKLSSKSGKSEKEVIEIASLNGSITENLFSEDNQLFLNCLGITKNKRNRVPLYVTATILPALILCSLWWLMPGSFLLKLLLSVFSFAPFSVFFNNIVNRKISKNFPPQKPMRLKREYADVSENKTAVVLTVMLSSVNDVKKSVKTLEEYFLGNRLENGVYLILADLKESDTQILSEDSLLTEFFENSLNDLNERYGDFFGGIIRGRQKNGKKYSGWERKRGAIEQLVKYITKKEEIFGTFHNKGIVENVKYICTLDADTVVPPDSIIKLLGVIAHPVNKEKGLVQSNIGTVPENRTLFQKILASTGGIDAYSIPLGEVYNDFFNSGTFCGKGIFDVDVYEEKVKIQPNTVLSHDLLEGEILGTIGANDVSFLDEFPKTPVAYYKRKERWLRGDWILFPYLFSSLKPLSKWKIFYNLLQAKFYKDVFLKAFIASFFGVYAYLIWFVCLIELSMPTIFAYLDTLRFSMEKHAFYDNKENRRNSIKRSVLNKLFLPFEFYIGATAMAKGLWRRLLSHKKILEWNTFASVNTPNSSKENFTFFLPSVILAVLFYVNCVYNGVGIILGLVASVLWCATPYFAKIFGQKEKEEKVRLLPDEIHNLKLLSMRTLRFFYEALEDNEYLMPDNLQLKPYKGYAKRTSPTNLGFALLSVPCGFKTGAYSPSYCISSLKKQINAIKNLDTFKGHLYNWYDISKKKPLNDYVSAVDSGNYCASLITVKGSLSLLRKECILGKTQCEGIGDLLNSYLDSLNEDFKNYLNEYDFYGLFGKKAAVRIDEFLKDGIISTIDGIQFVRELLKSWLDDYNGLSFSKKLFEKIDETEEFNLRPLRDFLKSFPKPIDEVLSITDFDCRLEELVWSLGREKYGKLLKEVRNEFRRIYNYAYSLSLSINEIEKYIDEFLENADFRSLYNPKKKLLAIGMDKKGRSINCYDMLISEARLTSFISIALGKIPAEHWFNLSRPFTRVMEMPLCLSWSGTMFEYLMPDIFIKPTENSMLSVSNKIAVKTQMDFSGKNGLWGISESAFREFDFSREYKYKALGVPKLKISAEKSEKVFSPYSTLLAFDYAPRECMDNIVRFVENGCAGIFGMFEAFDTKRNGIVYSHMAHHSGMGLTALVNYLYDGAVRKMFVSNSFITAVKVLLEEKMPLGVLPRKELKENENIEILEEAPFMREFMMPDKQSTETLVLSGDELRTEITSKGEILLFKGNVLLGEAFLYLKGEKTNSISYLPVREEGAKYKTVFYPEKAEFSYSDGRVSAKSELFVLENSKEFLWRVKVKNEGERTENKKVILVIKPALCDYQGYLAHPYFNGLFIESEIKDNALFVHNRKSQEKMHLCALNQEKVLFETDALKVLGRGNDFSRPLLEFNKGKKYPITPLISCGAEINPDINEEAFVDFLFSENISLIKNKAAVNLAVENAKNTANADISAFSLKKEEWLLSLKIAALKNSGYRQEKGSASADTLWQYGISDSIPLMTVILPRDFSKEKLKHVLKSADHLMSKGFLMQVLIIEDTIGDYLDGNFNYTDREIRSLISKDKIYHVKRNGLSDDKLREIICLSFLKIDLDCDINEQIKKVQQYIGIEQIKSGDNKYPVSKNEDFEGEFDNGFGKFINDGKEYFIYQKTPMPWSNVISNEGFGTLTTENGGGYTWQGNSALNKLSPWFNDAVTNPLGEALYLRDDKLNRFWSITRDPIDMGDEHSTVFGKGYSVYRYNGFGMNQKQTVFVHKEKALKIIKVDIENLRDVTAYYFIKPLMNEKLFDAHKYTEILKTDGMLCAKRNNEYMFIYAKDSEYCDNEEMFFGNGTVRNPDALRIGEFKKCDEGKQLLALKTKAKESFSVFIGYAKSEEELKKIKTELDNADVEEWLEDVKNYWDELSGRVKIKTPDRKLDIIFNNWLYYQSASSRFQARCGFYQAGGAWGFRDQLQDCLAMIISEPEKVRKHILKCAAHQFREGDVQHWWHETYLGVRTLVSDDLLFLPYVASQYARMTGDKSIFSEEVFFLEGHHLPEDRDDLYENAWQSEEKGTLYEHCLRAIKLAIMRSGQHGLPLILGGDWNDGMNNLGKKGKGESVWLGWFLYTVISDFIPFASKDKELLINHAKKLYNALNTSCWDGEWYLRAFDDNNRKIGSRLSECAQIDAISQAWSVLSGIGKKAERAMKSVEESLIDYDRGIVKLLTPPFKKEYGAGYIGDYIPGVRENGGQYTHGALWVARAFLEMGNSEKGFAVLDMINPISHSMNKNSAIRYKLEPYSIAADIYSNEENNGRGGWSWYTASSALYFNTVLSGLLGVNMEDGKISVSPHIPPSWREFFVKIDSPEYKYDIKVLNPLGRSEGTETVTEIKKDGFSEIRVVM